MLNRITSLTVATTFLCAVPLQSARAVVPSDSLMPPSTVGYASIADLTTLSDQFAQTQLGHLVEDDAMRPFVQDMKRQLQRKLSSVRDKLGLELGDLKGVASGEVALGMIEQEGDRAAVLMTVDITGRHAEAQELLVKAEQELVQRNAKKRTAERGPIKFTMFDIPPKTAQDVPREAIFFIYDDMLIGSDDQTVAEELLGRWSGKSDSGLAGVEAYQVTMSRCTDAAGGLEPELRWYIDPFGYARAARSLSTGDRPRGKDYLKILKTQGFDAILGLGGFLNMSVGGVYEILHRTSVYAPPIEGEKEKYRLAMRMLELPNSEEMQPQPWMPRKLASYRTFNVDLLRAFDNFDSLFDAIAGYDDAFAGVIEGLEVDPYGPQVQVRKDFVSHLGQRLTLVTDYEVPITTESERFLFAVDVTNEAKVRAAIRKIMEADPNAHETEFQGETLWEIAEPQDDFAELEIGVIEFDPLAPAPAEEAAPEQQSIAQNSAVCVSKGHLLIASHAKFLKRILANKPIDETLAAAEDYNAVNLAMNQLITGPACARCFVRTDEAYRPTYELLRQGKMPEARTLLGRLLNRMLTPPEDEDEGVLRKQKIDARALPTFEMVRRYFSPAGAVIRSEDDGWLIVGAMLSKRTGQARVPANSAVSDVQIR